MSLTDLSPANRLLDSAILLDHPGSKKDYYNQNRSLSASSFVPSCD